jgi:hypothetical protein
MAEVESNCGEPDSTYIHSQVTRSGPPVYEGLYYPGGAEPGISGHKQSPGTIIIGPFYRRRDAKIVNYDFWVYDLGANCKTCRPWALKVIFLRGRVVNAKKVKAERP